MVIKRVLCVCVGNSDRSPMMAAVLGMFLKNAGRVVVCESAGTGPTAAKGTTTPFAIRAAQRIGLDISQHVRRRTTDLDLKAYDLIVCANDQIAGEIIEAGAPMKNVYNVQVPNPWPVQFEADYHGTVEAIMAAMYRVIVRYFSY